MKKTPNIKVQAQIWVSLVWILFTTGYINLYYRNNTFNFDVSVFGLVMTGLLLWGLGIIGIRTLLTIFAFNICKFYIPIMLFLLDLFHPYVFVYSYYTFCFYVIYRCFCYFYFRGRYDGKTDAVYNQRKEINEYDE